MELGLNKSKADCSSSKRKLWSLDSLKVNKIRLKSYAGGGEFDANQI